MTRKEVTNRLNALPKVHRVTIAGNDLEQEIRWLEREKKDAVETHKKNLNRLNEKIKCLTHELKELSD